MIDKKEVEHIAKLAKLDLKESEIKKFQKDISEILDYFNLLKQVDTNNVKPLFYPVEYSVDSMREDKENSQTLETINRIIESAPERKERYVKVKKIL
ncbi:MAG: Asp-tRNA(Asn)/Glu-tRNA(Gln) amidotransferase subunit GatC [Candidatus Nealsonbacteria bacterium]